MKSLKEKLIAIDNGRFKNIIESLRVNDICFNCHHFNYIQYPNIEDGYRCKCEPFCIAATLHPELQDYLLRKLFCDKNIENKL